MQYSNNDDDNDNNNNDNNNNNVPRWLRWGGDTNASSK